MATPTDDELKARVRHEVQQVMQEVEALLDDRNTKYGITNIGTFGEMGCLVRASDKLARLRYVVGKDVDEAVADDAWRDLVGYAILGLICRRGKWPRSDDS